MLQIKGDPLSNTSPILNSKLSTGSRPKPATPINTTPPQFVSSFFLAGGGDGFLLKEKRSLCSRPTVLTMGNFPHVVEILFLLVDCQTIDITCTGPFDQPPCGVTLLTGNMQGTPQAFRITLSLGKPKECQWNHALQGDVHSSVKKTKRCSRACKNRSLLLHTSTF